MFPVLETWVQDYYILFIVFNFAYNKLLTQEMETRKQEEEKRIKHNIRVFICLYLQKREIFNCLMETR
jgi:hypothetical protein